MSENERLGAAYYENKASRGSRLRPLGRPCHDCAVICDFYRIFSDELALQPEPIRTEAALRWSCHNHPNRACRGNLNNLAMLATAATHGDAP